MVDSFSKPSKIEYSRREASINNRVILLYIQLLYQFSIFKDFADLWRKLEYRYLKILSNVSSNNGNIFWLQWSIHFQNRPRSNIREVSINNRIELFYYIQLLYQFQFQFSIFKDFADPWRKLKYCYLKILNVSSSNVNIFWLQWSIHGDVIFKTV